MSKEKPFEILRFDILLFCGSLFRTGEVSYKETEGGRGIINLKEEGG
jgi:hypothetical protein